MNKTFFSSHVCSMLPIGDGMKTQKFPRKSSIEDFNYKVLARIGYEAHRNTI